MATRSFRRHFQATRRSGSIGDGWKVAAAIAAVSTGRVGRQNVPALARYAHSQTNTSPYLSSRLRGRLRILSDGRRSPLPIAGTCGRGIVTRLGAQARLYALSFTALRPGYEPSEWGYPKAKPAWAVVRKGLLALLVVLGVCASGCKQPQNEARQEAGSVIGSSTDARKFREPAQCGSAEWKKLQSAIRSYCAQNGPKQGCTIVQRSLEDCVRSTPDVACDTGDGYNCTSILPYRALPIRTLRRSPLGSSTLLSRMGSTMRYKLRSGRFRATVPAWDPWHKAKIRRCADYTTPQ